MTRARRSAGGAIVSYRVKNTALLRGLIDDTGRTHKEIAVQAGVSPTLLSLLLAGRRTIRPANAKRLYDALGTGVGFDRIFLTHIAMPAEQTAASSRDTSGSQESA